VRVIAGRFRSRRLKSVPGLAVRPTPDRLRESLFSILAPRLQGAMFVDAYAGSGAVGIEALSRGAKHVIFIERSPAAIGVLRQNLDALGVEDEATVLRGNVVTLIGNYHPDIAFIDPPYDDTKQYTAALLTLATTRSSLVLAQHSSRLPLAERYATLSRTRVLKQGDNLISFYEPADNIT
jgi:16S rRNA (guanine966-N2)-methyltransferase